MKKYLSLLFLIVLIVPSIAFASWWNPFSWNIFSKKEVVQKIQVEEQQKTPEEKITELQKQLDDLKNQQSPTIVPTSIITQDKTGTTKPSIKTTTRNVVQPSQIIDVCLNIEGVQSQIPTGYSSVSGICTLIDLKDVCPNIEGIQSKIPEGKFIYKNTNQCLTENEINVIEYEKDKESLNEIKCQTAKENVVELNKELLDTKNTFQKKIDYMNTNPNGIMRDAMNAMISQVNQQEATAVNKIYAEISLSQSEVQLYCDN